MDPAEAGNGSFPAKRSKQDLSIPVAPAQVLPAPLFVDPSFPRDVMIEHVEWRRPKEICTRPRFIVDEATRRDVCQGNLSNCWFLSAVACLSLYPHLLEKVVPAGQGFEDGYNGSFRFQFWQYGEWVEVVVDDLLPTVRIQDKGERGQGRPCYNLLFLRSNDTDEFWSSLLEKAYAKLKGGYSALQLGFAGEALVDMTGGIVQQSDTSGSSTHIWNHLNHMLERGALICCGNTQGELETTNLLGILSYHMYSVTGARPVETSLGTVSLLRLRNPWGHTEWLGPWRDGGPEWQSVADLNKIEVVVLEDGEFWMDVEDFQSNFQLLEICHLGPESLTLIGGAVRPWECVTYTGRWVKGLSAGGSVECRDSYWMNPQFPLVLCAEGEEEGNPPSDQLLTCSFIVSVMHKYQRLRRAGDTRVACHIFQGDAHQAYLFQDQLRRSRPLLAIEPCDNHREVVLSSSLSPGCYVIIPSLQRASDEGEFLIRVLTEKRCPRSSVRIHAHQDVLALSGDLAKDLCHKRFLEFANQDRRVTDTQLLRLLTSLLSELVPALPGFTLDTCRCLLATYDSAVVGSLSWEQFAALWEKISAGTHIFCSVARQELGRLGRDQIVPALQAAGLPMDDLLVKLSQLKYGEADGSFYYPNFICCLLKLQHVTGLFQTANSTGSGTVTLNYRQWLQLSIYS
ncbi:calpain-12 [Pelodytes ibericus]